MIVLVIEIKIWRKKNNKLTTEKNKKGKIKRKNEWREKKI